jgi:hypothetical protein
MRTIFAMSILMGVAASFTACDTGPSRYDAEASRGYRAAWEKRRAGDEAGYTAGLKEVATHAGTWAGDRARLDLATGAQSRPGSFLVGLIRAMGESMPSLAPKMQGAPAPTP